MSNVNENSIGQMENDMELEVIELGQVTEETKGNWDGANNDGGFGLCWC